MLRVGTQGANPVLKKPVRYITTDLEEFQRARLLLTKQLYGQKDALDLLFNPGDFSFFD